MKTLLAFNLTNPLATSITFELAAPAATFYLAKTVIPTTFTERKTIGTVNQSNLRPNPNGISSASTIAPNAKLKSHALRRQSCGKLPYPQVIPIPTRLMNPSQIYQTPPTQTLPFSLILLLARLQAL